MTHPACKELLSALADERLAITSFIALLQQEQGLLTENSIDPLLTLSEKKSAQAIALNRLTEARQKELLKCSPSLTTPSSIRTWLESNTAAGLAIWLELLTLAEQARQLNQINGELIQMKLRHNQQLLTALSRAVSQADLYGPDGQSSFSAGSGRSLGSV